MLETIGNSTLITILVICVFFDLNLRGTFDATSGNYSSSSDVRFKTNIRNPEGTLSKLMQVQPRIYNFKTDLDKSYYGFIAQDLQKIYPELVKESKPRNNDESSTLMIDYAQVSVLSVNAIQEQQKIIENQQLLIEELIDRIEKLENEK